MTTDHNEAMRLAESIKTRAIGWTEWRVESPVDGSYVMVFTQAESLWPEKEASEWLALHKQHHPNGRYANYVVAKHHCYSKVEQDAIEAAALLRQQAERIAELEGERDQHKATAASLLSLLADIRMACGDNGKRMQPELVEFIGAMSTERDQLRAEVARLRADAERLDWLESEAEGFGGIAAGPFATDFGKHTHNAMAAGAKNCTAAIEQLRGK